MKQLEVFFNRGLMLVVRTVLNARVIGLHLLMLNKVEQSSMTLNHLSVYQFEGWNETTKRFP